MKKNDIFEVVIEDMGHTGEGIGKVDGFPLFIKDAIIGDRVSAKVMKLKKTYGYARMMEVIEPSPDRTEAKCSEHKRCGGCQIQAMNYRAQLKFKQNLVINNLKRIGGFDQEVLDLVKPVIGMEDPWRYRNKAQYPVGYDREGKIITGFYSSHSHNIMACDDCLLGDSINQTILGMIKDYMVEAGVSAYDEESGKGLLRHVLIRVSRAYGSVMVCLVINGDSLPKEGLLIEKLMKLPKMTSISISVNKERSNVIMGDSAKTIWGQEVITDKIGDLVYEISPLSFFQVNPIQTKKLYDVAKDFAGLKGSEKVWDLYCGAGTIGLYFAREAEFVRGIEIVPEAIENAKANAVTNNIENVEFYVGKAEEVFTRIYNENPEAAKADVVVVDPPRKGCDEALLDTILKMSPDRMVYVSCDSATLARDLKILCQESYRIEKVQPVDLFPHTVHVETVVLLSRITPDAYITVDLDMSELDLTSAEAKATYNKIRDFVKNKYDLHVTNLNIAQVKQKHGIIERVNYNVGEGKSRVPNTPKEKFEAIEEALRFYKMI